MSIHKIAAIWLYLLTILCVLVSHPVKAEGYDAQYQAHTQMSLREQIEQYWFRAAKEGDLKIINTLIDAKFDLNHADGKGYTALILAAYHGHAEVVDRLLQAGANPCSQRSSGAILR
jgi:hypothetical protein